MRTLTLALAGAAFAGAIVFWLLSEPRAAFPESAAASLEQGGEATRGKRIFDAADCASCHASPGQKDRRLLGGGLALGSPFGTFYVPNISPDPDDGIGRWRTLDLANALLAGTSPDHRHYYPALPYVAYAHMELRDVQDLMAYLRELPPTRGRAPPHELHFPMTIRRLVGFWKLLYLERGPLPAEPSQSASWNRGRYLVEALGHCAECHSTRNLMGAIKPNTRFAGGPDQEGVGFVPNITPSEIGHWSEADIERALRMGRTPRDRQIGSSMADVVVNQAELPASDRADIATYVKSLPPRPTPPL